MPKFFKTIWKLLCNGVKQIFTKHGIKQEPKIIIKGSGNNIILFIITENKTI